MYKGKNYESIEQNSPHKLAKCTEAAITSAVDYKGRQPRQWQIMQKH